MRVRDYYYLLNSNSESWSFFVPACMKGAPRQTEISMNQADDHRYPTLILDIERYQAMLDAPDLSEAQKAELTVTL